MKEARMRSTSFRVIGTGLFLTVAVAAACKSQAVGPARDGVAEDKAAGPQEGRSLAYAPAAAPPPAPEVNAQAAARVVAAAPPAAPNVANLKLIRTGQVTLEVTTYGEAANQIAALARAHGGYVAGSQSDAPDGERRRGTLTLRIPADRFDAVFSGLKSLGKVLGDRVDVQDVTKAYFDLETRLRVKRDTEARLREILRTRTARLSDVLEAERELARVTEEIEGMEGTRRFYDEQAAFATVTVSLQEPRPVVRPGALEPLREALRDSLRQLARSAATVVYLAVFLLPWTILAAVPWFAWRAHRRRAARTQAAGA
jgi:Domain of unknown function (DUF4349)